jgi:hypothetical protein
MKKKKDRSPLSLLITMMNTEEQQARAAAASRAVWLHHHGDVATSKFHSSGPREEGKGDCSHCTKIASLLFCSEKLK